MTRHVFGSSDALAAELVRLTLEHAEESVTARGRFTLALTGGSAASTMYPILAQAPLPWAQVEIYFGDERCVPPDHADSNFALAKTTLLDRTPIPPANVHRIKGEIDPAAAADEYAKILPVLDVLHLGMGPDGHVLSLFPGHPLLASDRTVAHLTDSPKPPPARVTLCLPAVAKARSVWFLVAGANKADAVRQALDPSSPLPAARAAKVAQDVRWLLDADAAKHIRNG